MNENENNALELEDDWDDIDLSDVTDNDDDTLVEKTPTETKDDAAEEQPEADQQKEESTEEPDNAETKEEPKSETDQFTLKHFEDVRTVGRDEVIALAQKGMDYDRVKSKLDEKDSKEAKAYSFLEELAKENGSSVEDFMDGARATVLAKREGIEYDAALQKVKLQNREKAIEEQEHKLKTTAANEQAEAERKERIRQDAQAFQKAYPGIAFSDVPREVWEKVEGGMSLLNAYGIYDMKKQQEKLEADRAAFETAKKEAENSKKSTGSVNSSSSKEKSDPFDDLWYDGT